MIALWATAALLSAAAVILVLFRAARAATAAETGDTTSVFYRRQLAEIGDLADRGLIGADERKGAEAEAGRRLLAAADAPAEVWSAGPHRAVILTVAIGAPVLALAVYMAVGSPQLGDQPFKARLAQWQATPPQALRAQELAALVADKVKGRPTDPDGYKYLALARGGAGDLLGAVEALRRGVRVAPERADLWQMLGEAELYQANGELTDDAVDAFRHLIKLEPNSLPARFQLAAVKIRDGDKAGGLADWKALLAEMPASDPRRQNVQAAIASAEGAPPPPAAAAPQGLSADQMTAVRGMVAGLAARLAASPDDPAGWVQLVKAYAVLGDTQKRDAALKTARARYAGKPDVLAKLSQAAATEKMK
ncbi:c-type cytochrome biogenesis protein CcmI [Phenylobacterium sp.]|uniref:c-type cytochrome biogenesis protein CcmI n=1 Tax=Phenylobacterium sp. TaxID=1871053 RepID=UPI002B845C55|nr:c-type cytochrome biogenesis protein CcmI [Phenylobacterium sp.]HLZ76458.1 c-type cytochrome biogenesis protein CcmI [Phenylobacterium sp.]